MSAEMEFDLGPLTWVKGEIDNALDSARAALDGWSGEDITPVKTAAAHLHQVYGALQIVDLQGLSLLTSETERLLAEMADQESRRTLENAAVVLRAVAALKGYLDGLMAGAPHAELKLAPSWGKWWRAGAAKPWRPANCSIPIPGPGSPARTPSCPWTTRPGPARSGPPGSSTSAACCSSCRTRTP